MSLLSPHPSFAILADFVENRLSPDQSAGVAGHLAGCDRCQSQVAWLSHTISLMQTDPSEDAPPAVIDRAVGIFRVPRVVAAPSLRQRLVAALRFDSGLSLAYGLRTGQTAPRQLLFETQGYDIDIRLTPEGNNWAMVGQVLGETSVGQVELTGGETTHQTTLTEQGEFSLPAVPAGRYSLTLRLSSLDLVVPELDLGPQ